MISTKPTDQFRTPQELFDRYNRIYAYTIDGAASDEDCLVLGPQGEPAYWGPGGLGTVGDYFHSAQDHWQDQRIWINPPYSMIPAFLEHWLDVGNGRAGVVTWLLPAWVDRRWFHAYIWGAGGPRPGVMVDFLPGRLKFLNPDGSQPETTGKFASMVVSMV